MLGHCFGWDWQCEWKAFAWISVRSDPNLWSYLDLNWTLNYTTQSAAVFTACFQLKIRIVCGMDVRSCRSSMLPSEKQMYNKKHTCEILWKSHLYLWREYLPSSTCSRLFWSLLSSSCKKREKCFNVLMGWDWRSPFRLQPLRPPQSTTFPPAAPSGHASQCTSQLHRKQHLYQYTQHVNTRPTQNNRQSERGKCSFVC